MADVNASAIFFYGKGGIGEMIIRDVTKDLIFLDRPGILNIMIHKTIKIKLAIKIFFIVVLDQFAIGSVCNRCLRHRLTRL